MNLLTDALQLRGGFARLWYRLLGLVPIPSESKWRGMEELLTLVSQATLEDESCEAGLQQNTLEKAMEQAGSNWMWKRSEWLVGSNAPASAVNDLVVNTFKTLDMPTSVHSDGSTIRAVTFRCPFVEKAKNSRMARKTCQVMCSQHRSLFHGFVQGLPVPVRYLAPSKMGWGDSQCVKEFHILDTSA